MFGAAECVIRQRGHDATVCDSLIVAPGCHPGKFCLEHLQVPNTSANVFQMGSGDVIGLAATASGLVDHIDEASDRIYLEAHSPCMADQAQAIHC